MSTSLRLVIGTDAQCTDGPCGVLRRVVLDPERRVATHLVVEHHRSGSGRLVPLELLDSVEPVIRLRCSHEAFEQLDPAEHLWWPGYDQGDQDGEGLMSNPYYGFDTGAGSVLGDFGGNANQPVVADSIPDGDVEVRPHDEVRATDGHLGSICGVVVESDGFRLTHVLAHEGHLWRKHEVAIPMSIVGSIDLGVTLTISKEEAGRLPAVEAGAEAPRQRGPSVEDRESSS